MGFVSLYWPCSPRDCTFGNNDPVGILFHCELSLSQCRGEIGGDIENRETESLEDDEPFDWLLFVNVLAPEPVDSSFVVSYIGGH